jgi:hypothetical protein
LATHSPEVPGFFPNDGLYGNYSGPEVWIWEVSESNFLERRLNEAARAVDASRVSDCRLTGQNPTPTTDGLGYTAQSQEGKSEISV